MPRPLRIGLQLPEVERDVRWPEYVAIARAAEEVGFDSVWLGEHMLYRGDGRPERGPWDAWTALAALAASTERVTLGPLVACLAFHAPGVVARQAAAIDEISGGRFVLAVGSGWNEPEFRAFGFPFERLTARFEESFEIVRRLMAGEHVTFAGEFWQVDDAVLLPPQRRRTRLMVGANGPRMLAATLPHVDIWNTWYSVYGNTAEGFAAHNAEISARAERAGRDPAEIERSACAFVVLDGGAGERPHDGPLIEGPPGRIADALRALAEAGADEAILVVDPINERSVRQLGDVLAELGC